MSRVRDIANILSTNTSMATDTEVSVVSAQIPSQVAGKNIIINGGFDIWQRGTSFTGITAGNTYVADRWTTGTAGSYNIYVSRQPTGDTVNLPNIQHCLRFGRTSGTSGANWNTLNTSLETTNSIPFAGRTITLSFYARAGANFSSSGNTLASFLLSGTGVDQNIAVSYTGQLYSYGGHTLTTSWQRFTNTYTVPTNATELSISLQYVPTGTAGANDYYEVTGVQLEASSAPTPFSRAGGNIQGELAACQRYFQTMLNSSESINSYENFGIGLVWGTNRVLYNRLIPVTMRTAPSISLSTVGDVSLENATVGAVQATNYDFFDYSPRNFAGSFYCAGTPFTIGQGARMRASATSNARIYLSAEL